MNALEHGQRIEAEQHARALLVALARKHGYSPITVDRWRFVAYIDGLAWFERLRGQGRHNHIAAELHIAADGVAWGENGKGWRVLGENEVKRLLFVGL